MSESWIYSSISTVIQRPRLLAETNQLATGSVGTESRYKCLTKPPYNSKLFQLEVGPVKRLIPIHRNSERIRLPSKVANIANRTLGHCSLSSGESSRDHDGCVSAFSIHLHKHTPLNPLLVLEI